MLVGVDPHWSAANCFTRRAKLCLGYEVEFCEVDRSYQVDIFSVQNGRTEAFLGRLFMQVEEWKVFHSTLYRIWEDLDYPKKEDKESI